MSIAVALVDLESTLDGFPWGYLLTVADDGRPRVRAVPTRFVDGRLCCATGEGARSNVASRPQVTMVFPAPDGGMSLIVDGDAEAVPDGVALTPTSAVLHRAAIRD
ncbi:MAG: pyridoxamine 5-phosphate oxidase family protein [Ilumatobacteraceae bacterium]|nr:pyridoxamine 5-phosphate oxidase family protein [Ilumatobacteraceae bacterium]